MSKRYKILVVDDEQDIIEIISYNLKHADFEVLTASNGADAIRVAKNNKPDLILLDIMMPFKNGFEVCAELRQLPEFKSTYIFFLTALSNEENEIKGFEAGGDDYISKPIKPKALVSRIQSALNRNEAPGTQLDFPGISIQKENFQVLLDGQVVVLARKEFELLALLASKPGKVFEREEILNKVWGSDIIVGDRTIDVHIRKIRQKLNERFIFTVKGVGYKFEA